MKPEQLVALGVRLFSIILALSVFRYIGGWLPYTDFADIQTPDVIGAGISVAFIFIALLLWFTPNRIARGIVPIGFNDGAKTNWTIGELYGFGFVLVGTYYLFKGVSDGLYWIFFLIARSRNPLTTDAPSFDEKTAIILTVVELAASVGLIIGSAGLAKLIIKIRYGGSG